MQLSPDASIPGSRIDGYRNSQPRSVRLYGLGETRQLLKRTGFVPTYSGDHTFAWQNLTSRLGLGDGGWMPTLLRSLLPIHKFSATLRFVAVMEAPRVAVDVKKYAPDSACRRPANVKFTSWELTPG